MDIKIDVNYLYKVILENCQKALLGTEYPDIWLEGIASDFLILDQMIKDGITPDDWT